MSQPLSLGPLQLVCCGLTQLHLPITLRSPPLVAESYDMEPSSVVEVAANDLYGMLTDHNGVDHFHIKGNKENDECSNRGL